MKNSMQINGLEYISSRRAAEITGYSNDYVGQLCRSKKIIAKLVGRTWFINVDSLKTYENEIKKHVADLRLEQKRHAIHVYTKKEEKKEDKLILEKEIQKEEVPNVKLEIPKISWKLDYHPDERSLLPELKKNDRSEIANNGDVEKDFQSYVSIKQVALAALLLVVFLGSTFGYKSVLAKRGDLNNLVKVSETFIVNQIVKVSDGLDHLVKDSKEIVFGESSQIVDNLINTVNPVGSSENIFSGNALQAVNYLNDLIEESKSSFFNHTIKIVDYLDESIKNVKLAVVDVIVGITDTFIAYTDTVLEKTENIELTKSSMLSSVGEWLESSKNWFSNMVARLFGSNIETEIVREPITNTTVNARLAAPIVTTKPIAVIDPPSTVNSVTPSNERIIVEPRYITTTINATDQSLLARIIDLERRIGSNPIVERPFLSRQNDALINAVDKTSSTQQQDINDLDDRVTDLEEGGGSIDTSTANTWTALQQFSNASSTLASVYNALYVGTTATTTILGNATSTFGAGIQASYLNITGTSATSTFARGIDISGGCFAVNGSCISSGGSGTVTSVQASGGTTGLSFSGGPITNSGTLILAGILNVANGGTGWSNISSGALLYGNGTSALATTTAGTNGNILALLNGVPTWTASTTFGTGLTYSGGQVTLNTSTANTWTALQQFSNASSTLASVYNALYVGTTATTTILGNATSTFGAGVQASYLNITGTSATSTFARGIDISGGCFAVNGSCVNSSVWTTAGNDIYYTTGNVGIGTTSPYAKLSVVGPVVAEYFHATSTTATSSVIAAFSVGSTTPGDLSMFSVGTSSPLLTVNKNTGFVGVGTTSLAYKLDVNGSLRVGGGSSGTGLIIDGAAGDLSIVDGSRLETDRSTLYFNFSVAKNNDFNNGQFYLKSNGFVGIGTTSPYAKLSVVGPVVAQYFHATSTAATSTFSGGFIAGSGTSGLTVLASNGNVGIGSSTPWRTLSVAGSAAFTGLTNDSTGYFVCLNTTTYDLSTSTSACGASSQRFKQNIQGLTYGLNEISRLRPVSFDWKEGFMPHGTHQIGFIAEEVANVIPEVIGYDSDGTITNLDYPKLTAVLVNAIKEQQLQINNLSNRVSSTTNSLNTSSEGIISTIRDILRSTEGWVVTKINATLAIFDRLETSIAAVSNGIEMKDKVTGEWWCLSISNGELDKIKGLCSTNNQKSEQNRGGGVIISTVDNNQHNNAASTSEIQQENDNQINNSTTPDVTNVNDNEKNLETTGQQNEEVVNNGQDDIVDTAINNDAQSPQEDTIPVAITPSPEEEKTEAVPTPAVIDLQQTNTEVEVQSSVNTESGVTPDH